MSQASGAGTNPPKVETQAVGSARRGAAPAVVPDTKNTAPIVVPGGAERPEGPIARPTPGTTPLPAALQGQPPVIPYMQSRPMEPGALVPSNTRPPYGAPPSRPPVLGPMGGAPGAPRPGAPPSVRPPPFLGGAVGGGAPMPARPPFLGAPGRNSPGGAPGAPGAPGTPGVPSALRSGPPAALPPNSGVPSGANASPGRAPPSAARPPPSPAKEGPSRANAPALAPLNTAALSGTSTPAEQTQSTVTSPTQSFILERHTNIQPTMPNPLGGDSLPNASAKDSAASRAGFSTLAGGTGNGPVPSDAKGSPLTTTSPTAAPADGPLLDHSHLQPGETVSLLSHTQTLDMYRKNAKKSNDPQLNYELAVFMLDVAHSLEATPSDPEQEAATEREALIKEATSILKKLADRGHCDSQYLIGDCYANGFGTPKGKQDFGQAYSYFTLAAKHGHPDAAYRAGTCYEKGWGCRRDAAKAVQFYRKAASQGHPGAQYRLGTAELNGELGLKRSAREGVKWLKRSAESATPEFPHALHELALLHEKGIHNVLFADPEYSCELLAMAGEMGYAPSAYKLGVNYEYGRMGCPQDGGLSIHMYNIAAQQNHKEACFALTAWYLVGAPGILPQSDTEAYLWAKRAAEQGLAKAEYACGYFAEMGVGTQKDLSEAKGWYILAAEHGDNRAHQRLSSLSGYAAKKVSAGQQSPSDESSAVIVQPLSAPFPGSPVNGSTRSLGVLKYPTPKAMRETQAFQRDLHYQALVAVTNERERSKEREALGITSPKATSPTSNQFGAPRGANTFLTGSMPRPVRPSNPPKERAASATRSPKPGNGEPIRMIQAGPRAGFAPLPPKPEPEPEPEAKPETKPQSPNAGVVPGAFPGAASPPSGARPFGQPQNQPLGAQPRPGQPQGAPGQQPPPGQPRPPQAAPQGSPAPGRPPQGPPGQQRPPQGPQTPQGPQGPQAPAGALGRPQGPPGQQRPPQGALPPPSGPGARPPSGSPQIRPSQPFLQGSPGARPGQPFPQQGSPNARPPQGPLSPPGPPGTRGPQGSPLGQAPGARPLQGPTDAPGMRPGDGPAPLPPFGQPQNAQGQPGARPPLGQAAQPGMPAGQPNQPGLPPSMPGQGPGTRSPFGQAAQPGMPPGQGPGARPAPNQPVQPGLPPSAPGQAPGARPPFGQAPGARPPTPQGPWQGPARPPLGLLPPQGSGPQAQAGGRPAPQGLPGSNPFAPGARPPGAPLGPNATGQRPPGAPLGLAAPSGAPGAPPGPGNDSIRPVLAGFRPSGAPGAPPSSGAPTSPSLPNPFGAGPESKGGPGAPTSGPGAMRPGAPPGPGAVRPGAPPGAGAVRPGAPPGPAPGSTPGTAPPAGSASAPKPESSADPKTSIDVPSEAGSDGKKLRKWFGLG